MTKVSKVCSFYASDWHLITMLLPHVNKMINEGTKITTILEQDSSNKTQILLSKLRLKNERQISRIKWNKTENIKSKGKEIFENSMENNIEIIVCGSKEYMNTVNKEIEDYVKNNNEINNFIKIINCYNIEEINVKEILQQHDSVLNTAGEKQKQEFLASIGY